MSTTPRPSSRLAELLASLAACSGVGYVAMAYSVSRYLTRTTPTASLTIPQEEHVCWDPIECRTSDGIRLSGWLACPPRPRATVALFHGFRGNRTRVLDRVGFLTEAGFRCVAFDHRGHGESGGPHTSFGFYEALDTVAVRDYVDERWPTQPRAALGISMGAAALAYSARESNRFDAIILESLYHDLNVAFRKRLGTDFPLWFRRFLKGVIWITERRLRLRMKDMVPRDYLHELETPVLLLTGSDDHHASPDEVGELFERCPEPREFHVIPGATHSDVCEVGGELYRRLILDFLERRLFHGRSVAA